MTRIRRLGAVVLAAPLAIGFPVLAAVPAQAAASTITAPSNGAVITGGSEVTARARYDFGIKVQLRVNVPGSGDTFLTQGTGAGSLSAPISLRRNGRYTVYLKDEWNKVRDSNTFTVRIPPSRPSGVSASGSGSKVTVRWNLGLENDLTGYSVSGSGVSSRSGGVGSFCSGTSCSTTLSVKSSASGSVPISVRAKRSNGSGGSVLSSASSASASVGGSGSTPPNASVPSYPAGSTPPNASTPLTPFNNQSPVTLPSVTPPGSTPGFTYPTPQVANQVSPKAQNVAATDSLQWGKSVGIALILLVVAAHLGTWTRRLRVAQAGVSHQGMAARVARAGVGRKRVSKSREQIAKAEAMARNPALAAKAATAAMAATALKDEDEGLDEKAKDSSATKGSAAQGAAAKGAAGKGTSGKKDSGKGALAKDALAKDALAKGASAGDTAVLPTPVAAAKASTKRRPATLGKRPGGVNVRLAKPDAPDTAEPTDDKGQQGARRRRRDK